VSRTYTEAQYSTPSAREMIRRQFLQMDKYPVPTQEAVEATARYMSRTLRIGGLRICRALVVAAIEEIQAPPLTSR